MSVRALAAPTTTTDRLRALDASARAESWATAANLNCSLDKNGQRDCQQESESEWESASWASATDKSPRIARVGARQWESATASGKQQNKTNDATGSPHPEGDGTVHGGPVIRATMKISR